MGPSTQGCLDQRGPPGRQFPDDPGGQSVVSLPGDDRPPNPDVGDWPRNRPAEGVSRSGGRVAPGPWRLFLLIRDRADSLSSHGSASHHQPSALPSPGPLATQTPGAERASFSWSSVGGQAWATVCGEPPRHSITGQVRLGGQTHLPQPPLCTSVKSPQKQSGEVVVFPTSSVCRACLPQACSSEN